MSFSQENEWFREGVWPNKNNQKNTYNIWVYYPGLARNRTFWFNEDKRWEAKLIFWTIRGKWNDDVVRDSQQQKTIITINSGLYSNNPTAVIKKPSSFNLCPWLYRDHESTSFKNNSFLLKPTWLLCFTEIASNGLWK